MCEFIYRLQRFPGNPGNTLFRQRVTLVAKRVTRGDLTRRSRVRSPVHAKELQRELLARVAPKCDSEWLQHVKAGVLWRVVLLAHEDAST